MTNSTIFDCELINLPTIKNRAGNITPIHGNKEIPFEIKRIFYLYDIPGGESRGAHAHYNCGQFLVAISGAFDVFLDDGLNTQTIHLNRASSGIYIPAGIWASEVNFSSGSVCLVLASHLYDEADYIRSYSVYKKYKTT